MVLRRLSIEEGWRRWECSGGFWRVFGITGPILGQRVGELISSPYSRLERERFLLAEVFFIF
jgi:hypothetical protein